MKFKVLIAAAVLLSLSAGAWWFWGDSLPALPGGTLELAIAPEAVEFDVVRLGESAEQVVTLTNVGQEVLELSAARTERPFGAFLGAHGIFLDPGESYFLRVHFRPESEGAASGTLHFDAANGASAAVELSGRTPIAQFVELTPRAVAFGDVTIGQQVSALVTLTNRGEAPFQLDTVQLPAGFELEPLAEPLAPGARTTLKLSFSPRQAGRHEGRLTLRDNEADRDLAALSLSGDGVDFQLDLAFGASPRQLDFGDVPIGAARKGWLTLSNSGNDELALTSITLPEGFYAPEGSRRIAAGRSLSFPITFRPGKTGDHGGVVQLTTNAAGSEPLGIVVAANGAAVGSQPTGAASGGTSDDDGGSARRDRFGFFPPSGDGRAIDLAAEPEFLDPVGEVPDELDPTTDLPAATIGSLGEGSDIDFIGYRNDVGEAHVGGVVIDRQSGRVELQGLQLPKVHG
ncbi:MAG: choice-of-anchor D domain-containing protein, partial [Myxococcales bacterium]|nr:choice-of-anchor D domain-containing protein [Myxococcales bacterium]